MIQPLNLTLISIPQVMKKKLKDPKAMTIVEMKMAVMRMQKAQMFRESKALKKKDLTGTNWIAEP